MTDPKGQDLDAEKQHAATLHNAEDTLCSAVQDETAEDLRPRNVIVRLVRPAARALPGSHQQKDCDCLHRFFQFLASFMIPGLGMVRNRTTLNSSTAIGARGTC